MNKIILILAIFAALFNCASAEVMQGNIYEIQIDVISSGGGEMEGSIYDLTPVVVGETPIGRLSGGIYNAELGFIWAGQSAAVFSTIILPPEISKGAGNPPTADKNSPSPEDEVPKGVLLENFNWQTPLFLAFAFLVIIVILVTIWKFKEKFKEWFF